jgi:hypothetical protein
MKSHTVAWLLVYHCKQSPSDPNAYAWFFTAPDATLYEGSRTIGTHKTTAANAGEESRVPFTAQYYFYKRRGAA